MATKELVSQLNLTKEIISRTVRFGDFSDESKHSPGVRAAFLDFKRDSKAEFIAAVFYGNGINEDDRGYVSVEFNCCSNLIFTADADFTCELAVKDAAGNKRFIRSFTFPYNAAPHDKPVLVEDNHRFIVHRYIARETLFNDNEDLLPDDNLTLMVDVDHWTIPSQSIVDIKADIKSLTKIIMSSYKIEQDSDGDVIVLSLNSKLAERFYEESSVFRFMNDTPMIESSTVKLHGDDINSFLNASWIIMGMKHIFIKSSEEIIKLYMFADKYDFQRVVRICRNLFKRFLNDKDSVDEEVDRISGLAAFFNDDILKNTVDRCLRNLKDGAAETKQKRDQEDLSNIILYFESVEESDEDRPEFDFYS